MDSSTKVVLGVVIVVLLILFMTVITPAPAAKEEPAPAPAPAPRLESMDSKKAESSGEPDRKYSCLEDQCQSEQQEYFSTCDMPEVSKCKADCMCADSDGAEKPSDFLKAGYDFKDWTLAQAVDKDVFQNHANFIDQRVKNSKINITGRTYSPDMHDSYDPTPWQGLRRPQAVPICNPTQVTDTDYNLYAKEPTFTWRTS